MIATSDLVALELATREASALRHPMRAMNVTLECGHMRLLPKINTSVGIGSLTTCPVCPPDTRSRQQIRMVCRVEETGALHPEFRIR